MAKRRKNADRKSPFKRGSPGVYAGRAALASILRRRKSWAEKGKARGTVQVSRPAATRCQLVGGCIGLRKGACCIRIGRGPGDRHTIIQFGFDFVSHLFNRPGNHHFDTGVAIRDIVVSGANRGLWETCIVLIQSRAWYIDLPAPVLLLTAKVPNQLGLCAVVSCHTADSQKSYCIRSIRVGIKHSPVSWTTRSGRAFRKEVRT